MVKNLRTSFLNFKPYSYTYKTRILVYYILAFLFRYAVFKLFFKFEIEGIDNLPKNNHCVLMPNHLSLIDSFVVLSGAYPRPPVHIVADKKLYKNRFFYSIAPRLNIFPIEKGAKQISTVRFAIKLVSLGNGLLWYPEGQRNKKPWENKMMPGKLGSGLIAHAVKVPVIPVFLEGTEIAMAVGKPFKWGRRPRSIRLKVTYGKPVPLDDLRKLPESTATSKKVITRIIQHIEAMRP